MKSPPRVALGAIALALLSALFFTSTYVLNRAAALDGGHWAWTAALRYVVTVPLMLPLMRGRWTTLWRAMRVHPRAWLLWSGIGFVLFYLCLSYAAASGPAWLVASTFQLTVVAGMLCAPLLYRDARARIPRAALVCGLLALAGVLTMQAAQAGGRLDRNAWIALGCVAVSAFAYPLGNRGLLLHLERAGIELDATQRVFGLSLASLPLWLPVIVFAQMRAGAPSLHQVWLAGGVALGAGIIATVLFFRATGMVRRDPVALAAAEAMQAAEILFATLIGAAWLGEAWPHGIAALGAGIVVLAIVLFSALVARSPRG
ncbi:multidrug resistance efflux transporter family protein [Cognatilysobacter lacus]|uniref:Multidrug resistance efflux transporter family protein n=1 Tax=Cognatilysobacter lacus TaxID=1643323 RepID=A0A5D8YJE7_9GAMM|nr:multidrug resistance efflux transporter family protein [Lysobacter lacus]TZF81963.1 multidrug resistance efflux transporter family protein [Lysobacter lacus]